MKRPFHILVVEDDPDTRDFMSVLLADLGHHVTLAKNGQEALDLVLKQRKAFDAIVMDMQMPLVDGVTATRQIRADQEAGRTPIMCLSAKASGSTEAQAREAGCDVYLTKPCWEEDLIAALSGLLIAHGVLAPGETI